jgi:hypothetical protein
MREQHRLRVFENKLLRRIFGPEGDEVTGEWRGLLNGELNGLYSSLSVMQVIKSSTMRSAAHVTRMEDRRGTYRVVMGRPEGKCHLEDLDMNDSVMLKWMFMQ